MIGMVRDRDLKTGNPMMIVYRINGNNTIGFSITIDGDKCTVTPYTHNLYNGVRFGGKFTVRYKEIIKFDINNKKEELFKYLYDKMVYSRLSNP